MGFLDFLGGVERQLNPLDNNATFKNPQGNGQNKSTLSQVKDTAIGFAKGAVSAPWYFLQNDIVNPVKETAGILSGNRVAENNATAELNKNLTPRKIAGNAAQLGLTFLTPGINSVVEGGVAKAVGEGVVGKIASGVATGATIGAPYNVANTLAGDQKLTTSNLVKSAVSGAGAGAALGGVAAGVGEGAKLLTKDVVGKRASAVSGLKPEQIAREPQVSILRDYADYKNGSYTPKPSQINTLISQARDIAKNIGIDITSGSPQEIGQRIQQYISNRQTHLNATELLKTRGGNGVSDQELQDLAKSNNVADIKENLDGVVPADKVEPVANAVAQTKDPNIVQNIIDTSKPPDITPGQSVIDTLQSGNIDKLNQQQANLYSAERSARLAKAQGASSGLTGRDALTAQRGALKGDLPKVNSSALVEKLKAQVSPEEVNTLLDTVRNHPDLQPFEKITAGKSVLNLFDEGKLPTPGEWALLKKSLGSNFTDNVATTAIDSLTNWQKIKNFGTQVLGMPKSVMASFDLSGGGRQGAALGSRFLPEWANAQKESLKFFVNADYFDNAMKEIASRENAPLYQKAKLALTGIGGHEEAFPTGLAEKVPVLGKGIAGSDRAYTGGLSLLRADSFDHIINNLKDAGIDPSTLSDKAISDIGRFINTASGRGNLGALEKHATSLGEALFSPRLWKSRLDMLNPIYYAKLDPIARKYALQSAGSFAAIAGAVLGLAAAAGAKVETDARSSDFLKIKVGNTRYDILGGFQQNLVLAHRELVGEKKSSISGAVTQLGSGKFGAADRLSILTDFIKNKENPVISTAQNILKGTDAVGNKVNPLTEVGKLFVPLNIQDTVKGVQDTGSIPKGLLKATLPGTVGIGVGTYSSKDIKPSASQQLYLDKLKKQGAPQALQDAAKAFYQTLKSGPSRANASDAINQALANNDFKKAQSLADAYNKSYAGVSKDWSAKYGKQYTTPELAKAYQSGKIILNNTNVKTRVKAIKGKK